MLYRRANSPAANLAVQKFMILLNISSSEYFLDVTHPLRSKLLQANK